MKETITVGNQKVKKKKKDLYISFNNEQAFSKSSAESYLLQLWHSLTPATTHSFPTIVVCLQCLFVCERAHAWDRLNSLWRTSQNSPVCWWHSTPLEGEVLFHLAVRESNRLVGQDSMERHIHRQNWLQTNLKGYSANIALCFHESGGLTRDKRKLRQQRPWYPGQAPMDLAFPIMQLLSKPASVSNNWSHLSNTTTPVSITSFLLNICIIRARAHINLMNHYGY